MVTEDAGVTVELDGDAGPAELLFHEQPGRAVVETTDPDAVRDAFDGVAPVAAVGAADGSGTLDLTVGDERLSYDSAGIADLRSVIERELS
jgi:phosphoribosylformylglycinamidine synthase